MQETAPTQSKFEELYQSYVNELFGFCVSKVRHREEALDIVQDSFIKLWGLMSRGDTIDHPRGLLYTIVRNKIIDHYRSVALQRVFPINAEIYDHLADTGSDAAEQMDLKIMLQTINTLPDQSRELLIYRYIDGLPTNHIADIFGITPNAASQKIKRAVESLKKKLNQT